MPSSSFPDVSSPFSGAPETVRLHVSVGSPLAEVFLIDHSFALIDRSVGDFDAMVEPGVYTVRARLGDRVAERLVVLLADERLDLNDELRVASPVPLEGTLRTHEFHIAHAVSGTQGRETPLAALGAGSGAEIFLMARRWSGIRAPEDSEAAAASANVPELSLLRANGESILDLARVGEGQRQGWDPYLSCRLSVDPGAYMLRWQVGRVSAEQSVQATRGWQTQVFLLEDASRKAERRQISILMGRPGEFRPDDPVLLQVEEARVALADERKVASERLDAWLSDKFENPMLGLFGAHLMLISRDARHPVEGQSSGSKGKRIAAPVRFNQTFFDHVVHKLSSFLGPDHPDVVALLTQTSDCRLENLPPVTTPPMLWRGWLLLIEASNERVDLVPIATWRRAIKLLPLRPFLVWSPEEPEAADEAWEREVGVVLAASARSQDSASDRSQGGAVSLETPAAPAPDQARRSLSLEMLAPRAAIDELAAKPHTGGEEGP